MSSRGPCTPKPGRGPDFNNTITVALRLVAFGTVVVGREKSCIKTNSSQVNVVVESIYYYIIIPPEQLRHGAAKRILREHNSSRDHRNCIGKSTSTLSKSIVRPNPNFHQGITYYVGWIFYNLFLHPLRSFPGPLTHRISNLPRTYYAVRGKLPFHHAQLHLKYGSVVRIGPDFLTYTDPQAWKDIYGHKGQGELEFPKHVPS